MIARQETTRGRVNTKDLIKISLYLLIKNKNADKIGQIIMDTRVV
jgi:hypothetical protein